VTQQDILFSLQRTLQEIEAKLLKFEANDQATKLEELQQAKNDSILGLKNAERKIVLHATQAHQSSLYL
jgi:hypothetical protein